MCSRSPILPAARVIIYLEPELAQRVGIFALRAGIDQTEVIKAAVTDYLARNG